MERNHEDDGPPYALIDGGALRLFGVSDDEAVELRHALTAPCVLKMRSDGEATIGRRY
jgi:hypothetical protein